jgi:uncharacterized cupin superfamily protein
VALSEGPVAGTTSSGRSSTSPGTIRPFPSLRSPDGWRELDEGDVVRFRRGETGAHQLVNRSTEAVRFLAVSTNGEPDTVIHPDSGQVGADASGPGGGGFWKLFRLGDAVDYDHGETPPPG